MKTKTYYHGTKENNLKEIIQARKLIQGNKNYSQSEDGYVYLFDEEYFGWAIFTHMTVDRNRIILLEFRYMKIVI